MQELSLLTTIPDDELLERLSALLQGSRRTEADLVAHIGEVDRRRLYARAAAPSMFAYCTEVLHLSEAEAYLRITAARAARRHPPLLAMLRDGRLHLSAIAKLAPHLTPENRDALLHRAAHVGKRRIEELVAEIAPLTDAPCLVRRLPERTERTAASPLASPAEGPPVVVGGVVGVGSKGTVLCLDRVDSPVGAQEPRSASTRALVEPLAPARYKVQFTASAELRDKLERLQALLRAELPEADLSAVIDRAVTQTLQRLEARRYGSARAPRIAAAGTATRVAATSNARVPAAGRHIPAAVRRAVFERDEGRCRYRDKAGRRCPEARRLEYHHLQPFAMGGAHTLDNVRLMCRTHNLYLAEHDYGRGAMAAYTRPRQEDVTTLVPTG